MWRSGSPGKVSRFEQLRGFVCVRMGASSLCGRTGAGSVIVNSGLPIVNAFYAWTCMQQKSGLWKTKRGFASELPNCCVECPKCRTRYLPGVSPYRNGSYLIPLSDGLSAEWILYCSCTNPHAWSRWSWEELKAYEVCRQAHRRRIRCKSTGRQAPERQRRAWEMKSFVGHVLCGIFLPVLSRLPWDSGDSDEVNGDFSGKRNGVPVKANRAV